MILQGFKVNFLGDSITEGVGVADVANCRYDNRLAVMCQLSAVNNYGIGGTRLAHQVHPSEKPRHDLCFCGRAYDMDTSADMVIVYGGINDFLHGDAPFGQMGDTTPATFCGAVFFLMHYLRENYGRKPIVFMTPARCYFHREVDDLTPSCSSGKPLLAYVDAILETAKKFDIPVLDLYRTLGLDPHDPKCYDTYAPDGLHFNDAGQAIIAQRLKEFLESLS